MPETVDHIVNGSFDEPTKLIGTDYPYSEGKRELQVDVLAFNKNTGTLRLTKSNAVPVFMILASVAKCSETFSACRFC